MSSAPTLCQGPFWDLYIKNLNFTFKVPRVGWRGETPHRGKAAATNPDDLSYTPRIQGVEEENQLRQAVL